MIGINLNPNLDTIESGISQEPELYYSIGNGWIKEEIDEDEEKVIKEQGRGEKMPGRSTSADSAEGLQSRRSEEVTVV